MRGPLLNLMIATALLTTTATGAWSAQEDRAIEIAKGYTCGAAISRSIPNVTGAWKTLTFVDYQQEWIARRMILLGIVDRTVVRTEYHIRAPRDRREAESLGIWDQAVVEIITTFPATASHKAHEVRFSARVNLQRKTAEYAADDYGPRLFENPQFKRFGMWCYKKAEEEQLPPPTEPHHRPQSALSEHPAIAIVKAKRCEWKPGHVGGGLLPPPFTLHDFVMDSRDGLSKPPWYMTDDPTKSSEHIGPRRVPDNDPRWKDFWTEYRVVAEEGPKVKVEVLLSLPAQDYSRRILHTGYVVNTQTKQVLDNIRYPDYDEYIDKTGSSRRQLTAPGRLESMFGGWCVDRASAQKQSR